jgi:membrane protein DedA with SNARE-associated domain
MFYTFVGAGIWNIILAIIGYYLYEMREQIFPYIGYILLVLGVCFTVYLVMRERKKRKRKNGDQG